VIKQAFKIACYVFFLMWATQGHAEGDRDFLLGPGDSIHITVYRNPEFTLDLRVSAEGVITFPLLGAVQIGGLSVPDAEARIARGLKEGGFVKEPQVNITLMVARSNFVSVLGQVNHPGIYPIEISKMRLSEALAIAGGITVAAGATGGVTGGDKVILKGTREGRPFLKEIDISSIYLDNKTDDDVIIAARDEIYVPLAPLFYIYGEVQRPGSFTVARNMTVMQALAEGGGLTPRGTERNIELQRRNNGGEMEKRHPAMTDLIQPNDVIFVHESLF
jgi:polysaccharide export outer membrane protein